MPGKFFAFLGKFLLFFFLFLIFWYVTIPIYNGLLAGSVSRFFPLLDWQEAMESIESVPKKMDKDVQSSRAGRVLFSFLRDFLLTVRVGKGKKTCTFDAGRLHFDKIILSVLVFTTLPVTVRRRVLVLLLALAILFLWHNLSIFIHLKFTFATDMDGTAFEHFSSKNFTGFQREFYGILKKLTNAGSRFVPVALWLFFFLRYRGKFPFLSPQPGDPRVQAGSRPG